MVVTNCHCDVNNRLAKISLSRKDEWKNILMIILMMIAEICLVSYLAKEGSKITR